MALSFYLLFGLFISLFSNTWTETVDSSKGHISIRIKGGKTKYLKGMNVTVICETTTSTGRIKWFQNGRRIAVTRRNKPNVCSLSRTSREFGSSCKETRLSLVLTDVTSKDTGSYSCEDPAMKQNSNEVQVNVYEEVTEATKLDLPTSVSIYQSRVRAVYGSTPITLSCTCMCDSEFIFTWDHGNITGNVSNVVRAKDICTQSLTLWVGWEQDGDVVTCTATNSVTMRKATENTTLNLQYMPLNPVITLHPAESLSEGDMVNITCRPRPPGKPKGRTTLVVRSKGDKSYRSSTHVNFTVSREDNGAEIACYVTNKYTKGNSSAYTTTRYLNVLYGPKLNVTYDVTTTENGTESVTFTCDVDSNPGNVTFKPWQHMNGRSVVRELEGENTATQSVLRMTSLTFSDYGIYICNASNDLGKNDSTSNHGFHWARLLIQGAPHFLTSNDDDVTTVTTQVNTTLTLTYRYVANPRAKVTWYVGDEKVNTSGTDMLTGSSKEKVSVKINGISVDSPGYEERLTLPFVTSSDDGDYYVTACNMFGCRNASVLRVRVSDDVISVGTTVETSGSTSMGLVIGLSVAAAILVVVVVVVVVVVIQRRKSGGHDTSRVSSSVPQGFMLRSSPRSINPWGTEDVDSKRKHHSNGITVDTSNPTYDRDCVGENGTRCFQGVESDKDSVMVIIKSSLYGKTLLTESRHGESHQVEDAGTGPDYPGVSLTPEEEEREEEREEEEEETGGKEGEEKEEEEKEEDEKEHEEVEVSEETKKIVTEIYSQVQKPRSQKDSTISDVTGEDNDVTDDIVDDAFKAEDEEEMKE